VSLVKHYKCNTIGLIHEIYGKKFLQTNFAILDLFNRGSWLKFLMVKGPKFYVRFCQDLKDVDSFFS